MAGNLYDVLGNLAFASGAIRCPDELKGGTVTLKCGDGAVFSLAAEAACISSDLRTTMLEKGIEDAISLPFKKSLVSKLCEYMTYHKDTPFAEIKTPLESDSLQECGALKFDANFMKVEKDILFDLMLAAQHMDIPSLLFLTGAQAALMVKDKDPSSIRKGFGMSNDLSQEEQDTLTAVLEKRREQMKLKGEDPGVTGVAAFISGLTQAAEKHGLSPLGKTMEPMKSKVSSKSLRFSSWRSVVMDDWKQLLIAPDEIKDDKEIMLTAIATSGGLALQYAGEDLLTDQTLILEAVKYNGDVLKFAAPELCEDSEFVMEAVMINGTALTGANEDLRGSKDFVLNCCAKGRGSAMKGATQELQEDKEFVLDCIASDPEAFKYCAQSLRDSREFTLSAVCRNGAALQYARTILKADREIVERAVANDPRALDFAHSSRRAELQGCVVPKDPVQAPKDVEGEEEEAMQVMNGPRTMGIPLMRRDEGGSMGEPGWMMRPSHMCYMSGMGTMLINMGQANYFAANLINEKMPAYDREFNVDSTVLLWGGVGGGVGMRWKAFASADVLNENPDALLTVNEARSILQMMATRLDAPEFVGGSSFDQYSRQAILNLTAGFGSGGGWKPSEDYLGLPSVPQNLRSVGKAEQPMIDAYEEPAEELPSEAPLGGWVEMVDKAPEAQVVLSPLEPQLQLEEGARVQLVGLSSRSGQTGVVIAEGKDGKWKVKLDADQGVALLKGDYLQPVATPSQAVKGVGLDLQAKLEEKRIAAQEAHEARRRNIEARRAEVKLQMEAKRAAREVL
mmetsp:Transcript_87420/g.187520  ORF Transcript_87420/g.187520 Transcript_87420/m.187520 type:complete len:793 (+) Transcript_87420:88-2466(+)